MQEVKVKRNKFECYWVLLTLNERMKKETIFIILLIIAVGLLIYNVYYIKKETTNCLLQPVQYGLKELEESNNAEINCMCGFNKPNSPTIILNSRNISVIK